MKDRQTTRGIAMSYPLRRISFICSSRLIALLLCMVSLSSFAQQSKTYTFDFKNASYENVLKQITDQAGVNFFYSNADLKGLKPLTLSVSNSDLPTLLAKVFTGTGLNYEIQGNGTVVIKAEPPKAEAHQATASKPQPEARTIKGLVFDATDKAPLPFVGITSKEATNFYSSTDNDGKFSVTLPANVKTLVFSFIGYVDTEVPVGTQSTLSVEMSSSTTTLDESIVVGYQTRKKSTLTGSVKALDGEVMQDKPVASFDQSLQGQVAGVYTMSQGAPGASSNVLIRGVASADYTVQPLYILDGAIISSTSFATLNPNDIEQFTVLKDAAATSIYGSLAAHGVVLITSKRGKDTDRPEISYRFQIGTSMLAEQNFTMMNTAQRLQYEEGVGLRTLDPTGKYYIDNGTRISKDSLMKINVDWGDVIFRNGMIQSHDLSLRGGNQNTRYFASLNYYSQEGILPASNFERMTFRINLDQNVTKYLKVGTSTTAGREFKEETPGGAGNLYNPVVASYALLPYYNPFNDDGQPVKQFDGFNGPIKNPLLYYQLSEIVNDKVKLVTNLYAELKLFPFLTFKSSLGYDYQDRSGHTYTSPAWDGSGSITRLYAKDQSLTNTNLFTYKQSFGKKQEHNLTVLLGEEYLTSNDESFNVTGSGLATDKAQSISFAKTITAGQDPYSRWATLSFFSQASYSYANKYYLDLSLRKDGSSRFGKDNKWGTFWSVGASWNAKREKFLENSKAISSLNVFTSTGTSGNSNIPTYEAYALYSYGGNNNYNGNIGSAPSSPGNSSLAWESVWKNNLGAEVTLWGKYRFKVEGFHNITDNMLFVENLSLTSSFEGRSANLGKMTNTGLEFEWDITLLSTENLHWRFNGNASYTVSKMQEMTEGLVTSVVSYQAGQRYGLFYLSRYAGADPIDGRPLWYDANGKLTSVYSDANKVVLNKSFIPPYTGGFGTDITYKRLSASIFFSWVADRYMLNNGAKFYNSNGALKQYNQSTNMLDYWKNPGDYTPYTSPTYASNQDDTRYLENASFLRLKNITLSYTLDPEYLKKTKLIRGARIYIQAQNLFTFTSYTGYDPENITPVEGNVYPQSRMFTFGLDLNF